jgi:hypothetical protein
MKGGLSASIHANPHSFRVSHSVSAHNAPLLLPTSPKHELERFKRMYRRLRWKLPYLADAHSRATKGLKNTQNLPAHEREIIEAENKEIELMFKLDFFEYYSVLERALLHLANALDIKVSPIKKPEYARYASLVVRFRKPCPKLVRLNLSCTITLLFPVGLHILGL